MTAANAEVILAAAHRLVAERGEDFTTQDLIKTAGVALQTFYRHYPSKDQLLLAVIADQIATFAAALEARAATVEDPVERLRLFVDGIVDALDASPTGARFITSQHWRLHQLDPAGVAEATRPATDYLVGVLAAGQASGAFTIGDPEADAWLLTRLVMSVFHHYAFTPADDPGRATVGNDLRRFCLAAVGAGGRAWGERQESAAPAANPR